MRTDGRGGNFPLRKMGPLNNSPDAQNCFSKSCMGPVQMALPDAPHSVGRQNSMLSRFSKRDFGTVHLQFETSEYESGNSSSQRRATVGGLLPRKPTDPRTNTVGHSIRLGMCPASLERKRFNQIVAPAQSTYSNRLYG